MAPKRGLTPAGASPAELLDLLQGHAQKSVRLALSCLGRWEELEAGGGPARTQSVHYHAACSFLLTDTCAPQERAPTTCPP